MSTETTTPQAVLSAVLERVPANCSDYTRAVIDDITQAMEATPAGTVSQWFKARHGAHIDTVQVGRDGYGAWVPADRVADSMSRAGGVMLDDSLREYAGMRVHAVTETCLIASTFNQVMAYSTINNVTEAN
jgi:hypothetical protein